MKMRLTLRLLAALVIVAFATSCASTPFSEKSSVRDGEITAFGEIILNSEVALKDLKNLGSVEVKRSVSYTLQQNGDYVIEMDGYSYSHTALDNSNLEEGTRVVGNLKFSSVTGGDSVVLPTGGFMSGLFGGLSAGGNTGGSTTASAGSLGPKQIVLDAVNYDLLQAASKKGAMALLLPEYAWEIEENLSGTDKAGFLFIAPSRTYESKEIVYTVTARAVAVSF